jgi:HEAT repeat protein
VQRLVESTLADLHRDDPWPFLDWMMGVDVPELLIPAVRVLQGMGSPTTVPLLRELVRSQAPALRAAAVRALGSLPTPETALLDGMAEDPSEEVRLAVLETIMWTGESLLRASLLRNDPAERVRAALAISLERFAGPATKTALKVVTSLLEDASPTVRAAALATLMKSGDAAGLHAFAAAWQATTLDARFALRHEPRGAKITEALTTRLASSTEAALRRAAVIAIAALAQEGFQDRLVPSLRDPSPDVRIAVIQALAAVNDPATRPHLAEMLSDPDGSVREVARRSNLRTVG